MLQKIIDWIFYDLFWLNPMSIWVKSINFFIYDSIKILFLLLVMISVIAYLRSYIPLEKIRIWVEKGNKFTAHLAAAIFGALTPFCTCSSIPIFLSLLKMRVPLGVSFSFLITSPILNEYLFVLMSGYFGVKIAVLYAVTGIIIGVLAGMLIGVFKLEGEIEKDFSEFKEVEAIMLFDKQQVRINYAFSEGLLIIKKIWLWVLFGVALGAIIHNVIPAEFIQNVVQTTGILAVPLVVLLGVPMYGGCAAIIPIAVALFQKGVPLGTALAFMMAVSALSLPEAIILRRAMKLKLILAFFSVVTIAIIFIGYVFNLAL